MSSVMASRSTRLIILAVWIVLDIVLLVWAGVCVGLSVFEQACMASAGISTGLLGVSMVVKLLYGSWIVWRTSISAAQRRRLSLPS